MFTSLIFAMKTVFKQFFVNSMSAPVPASSGVPFGVALPKTDRAPTPKRESSASSISASSTQPNSGRALHCGKWPSSNMAIKHAQ